MIPIVMKPMRFTWEGVRVSCRQYYEVAPDHSLYQDDTLIDGNLALLRKTIWKAVKVRLEKTLLN